MGLDKLVLTDFRSFCPPVGALGTTWHGEQPVDGQETAYTRLTENLQSLSEAGAITNRGPLYEKVSGFPTTYGGDAAVRNPAELFPGKELKLLWWGAPHWNPSSCNGTFHGSGADGPGYKTNAFESMVWLCPRGTVAMTFPAKFAVEFYQPCYHHDAANRILICGKMYSRRYVPMVSSDGLRYTIPDTTIDDTMIAILLPPSLMACVAFEGGRIDFGLTMRQLLDALGENEYGCALGVYDCSLEMELTLPPRLDPTVLGARNGARPPPPPPGERTLLCTSEPDVLHHPRPQDVHGFTVLSPREVVHGLQTETSTFAELNVDPVRKGARPALCTSEPQAPQPPKGPRPPERQLEKPTFPLPADSAQVLARHRERQSAVEASAARWAGLFTAPAFEPPPPPGLQPDV